jgi:hypothetical protein
MVPMADAARKSIKLLRNGITKTYPAICGMLTINADALNADLLAFIQVSDNREAARAELQIAGSVMHAHG